jgi:16S rRNA (cytidine1402-2'-O)-methyltransferase
MSNLYIVATPIGNLQDVTIRAANILLGTKIIISESTSKAGILLSFLEKQFEKKRISDQQIISFTENEEELKIPYVIKSLLKDDAALISEAGTPLVSDPGFKLVREAIKRKVFIIPVPGPSAAIAALSVSGLPTDRFIFLGFLPKKITKKEAVLSELKSFKLKSTHIIYESPDRLVATLKVINKVLGDMDIVVTRELTKIHEEVRREKVTDAIGYFSRSAPKGEFTILF